MLQVLRVSLGQSLLSRLFLSPSQHTKSLSLHGSRFSSLQRSASFTIPTVNPFMLRVAFLAYVLILPTLFASAIAEQLDFRAKNTVAEYLQITLVYHNDCRLICTCTSSRNISPTSQVFCLDGEPRHASIHSRHRSLGRLKPTDIRLLRAAWHSRGPRLHRLRDIVLNEEEVTVEIGARLTWIDVYSYLAFPMASTLLGAASIALASAVLPLAEVGTPF